MRIFFLTARWSFEESVEVAAAACCLQEEVVEASALAKKEFQNRDFHPCEPRSSAPRILQQS